ncbi:MAG: hypothetical protein R3F20_06580 [Planctomycetota bacterium]
MTRESKPRTAARWLRGTLLLALVAAPLLAPSCSDGGGGLRIASLLGGPAAAPDGSFAYDLTIAFSNDLHDQVLPIAGGRAGLARHASVLRALRAQADERGKGFLAMNAGDNFEGTLFYESDGGALVYRLLDAMGYDVVQIGNHDHQFGVQTLHDVIASAFPALDPRLRFLWGNVDPAGLRAPGDDASGLPFDPARVAPEVIAAFENAFVDSATGAIDPALMDAPLANGRLFNQSLFYDVGGLRVGVFGLDTDEILYSSVPGEGGLFLDPNGLSENLRFVAPLGTSYASQMIAYLEDPDGDPGTDDGADLVVAVTHLGFQTDLALAAEAEAPSGRRIDVVVGGHSHTRINTAVPVAHASGATTWVVQGGARGEFLGRIDLSVDPGTGAVSVANAELLEIDDRFAPDAEIATLIADARAAPGGVDAVRPGAFEDVIAQNPVLLPAEVDAITSLGQLAADGCREASMAGATPVALDAVLLGGFVFRGDLEPGDVRVADAHAVLPLHTLQAGGLDADRVEYVDLPGGIYQGLDPTSFPLPGPPIPNVTAIEYFLELVFGIEDILAGIGGFLGLDLGDIGGFVNGLQWSGISFTVDPAAPALQRIDPASITIGGVPLVGNESLPVRLGIDAVISRVALPFFQLLAGLEDPMAPGFFTPFPADPVTTDIVVWEGLRDRLAALAVLDAATLRVDGSRVRTVAPDLLVNPADLTAGPGPAAAGANFPLSVTVLNVGETAVTSATLQVFLDRTPDRRGDDPDGITDAETGLANELVTSLPLGAIPAWTAGQPGQASLGIEIPLPADLESGPAAFVVRIRDVVSADPLRPEVVTGNNSGRWMRVRFLVP